MKAYEILSLAQPMLDKLIRAGVNPRDVQHLELYRNYQRLRDEGHKMTYIEVYLCDEYGISKTKFYELIKAFGQTLS